MKENWEEKLEGKGGGRGEGVERRGRMKSDNKLYSKIK